MKRIMYEMLLFVILGIVAILLCVGINGCSRFDKKGTTVWGWGKVEYHPDGTIKSMECDSPVKDMGSIGLR